MIGRSTLLAFAAVAVALALQISSGFSDPWALAVVSLAAAAAVLGALWRGREGNPVVAQALLGAGGTAGLGFHLYANPTFSADVRAFQGGFHWFALISLVALSAYLCIHLRASLIRARFLLLLLCFAVMGIVALRASQPAPGGPWGVSPGGAEALVQAIGGDARYALLAAAIGGAWLLARAWPGNAGELAAVLVLFQPRALFVLEQGWAEPVVFLCFAMAVHAIARRAHPALIGAALALLAASTPYSVFLAVPLALAMPARRGPWAGGAAFIAGGAVFIAAGAAAIWRGAVVAHPVESLSLASFLIAPGLLAAAGIAVGTAVLVFSLRRCADLPRACAAAGAAWAVAMLSSPHSFANGWWLCSGVLAAAASASAPQVAAATTRRRAETLATAARAG